MKKKQYQCVCKKCGKKYYSKTTSKKGILCVECDPVIKENRYEKEDR